MTNKKLTIYDIFYIIGTVCILISAILVMKEIKWAEYYFAFGSVLYIINKIKTLYNGNDFRLKRLNRYSIINSVLLIVISYLQFKLNNIWVIFLFIFALIELYVSMRVSYYTKQDEENK